MGPVFDAFVAEVYAAMFAELVIDAVPLPHSATPRGGGHDDNRPTRTGA